MKIRLKVSVDLDNIDELRALRDKNPDSPLIRSLVSQISDGLQRTMDAAGEMFEAIIK